MLEPSASAGAGRQRNRVRAAILPVCLLLLATALAAPGAEVRAQQSPNPESANAESQETEQLRSRLRVLDDGGIPIPDRLRREAEIIRPGREKKRPSRPGPPTGPVYTWQDGDRTRTAYLQTDLTVAGDGDVAAGEPRIAKAGDGVIVRASSSQTAGGQPVFRSQSGSLMTLPGGVLLVFETTWREAQVDAFLGSNGISRAQLSPLGAIPNGFVVETAPGFPALDLANSLAGQAGVRLASPNWWQELVTK